MLVELNTFPFVPAGYCVSINSASVPAESLGMNCRQTIREETWGFPQLDADTLTKARFSESKQWYFWFRVAIFIYWSFWVSVQGSESAKGTRYPKAMASNSGDEWLFFIYVTCWTMVLEGIVFALALAAYLRPTHRTLVTLYWALRTTLGPCALLVTILYWLLVYSGGSTDWTDVHAHAINSIILLLDLAVSRLPYQFKHLYCPAAYIVAYMIFNAAWCSSGGRDGDGNHYIYAVLQYGTASQRSWSAILLCAILFVVFPIVHTLLFLVASQLRTALGPDPSTPLLLSSHANNHHDHEHHMVATAGEGAKEGEMVTVLPLA